MRQITTKRMLDHAIMRLNEAMETTDGVDEYLLSGAYGGWQVVRRNGQGVDTITTGFRPKREVYDFICAAVYGIRSYQDKQRIKEYEYSLTKT